MAEKKKEELHIRNMVCDRCVMVVRDTLESIGLSVIDVELGRVEIEAEETIPYEKIDNELKEYGFELIQNKNQQLVEQIKTRLIEYVQQLEESEQLPKLSEYLSEELNQNYSSLSSAFSENENITIEKYVIHLKIERVKELLSYGELTLSEIAWKLNYSSVAHLSAQFKQITGMSVTDYKKARESFRKPLDGIEK
ncbi:helix-turn-helix transcriptional regulator [Balneolaceae bacterium YR4-1]|uniref:Helix-turn-helix transcriptional regulator n=1 Tax=Halalkalibaculum roseum TaxID=2709311 RepID=A0A6M1SRZ5_9BACT|nr:AraC family transcriptional regulator [Halalkalibaculum roseum]NGP75522.1 helix-turn-helix transcriptional regulator [Halalkalibaculum roseum]